MTLLKPTDRELDAAFAEHVAKLVLCDQGGWTHLIAGASMIKTGTCSHDNCCPGIPNFTQSADAVLPWLEKHYIETDIVGGAVRHYTEATGPQCWRVRIPGRCEEVEDKSFPRAAVIALLRAHGIEIQFTPTP